MSFQRPTLVPSPTAEAHHDSVCGGSKSAAINHASENLQDCGLVPATAEAAQEGGGGSAYVEDLQGGRSVDRLPAGADSQPLCSQAVANATDACVLLPAPCHLLCEAQGLPLNALHGQDLGSTGAVGTVAGGAIAVTDTPFPRFSWQLDWALEGGNPVAFQLQLEPLPQVAVAQNAKGASPGASLKTASRCWDSGWRAFEQSQTGFDYDGAALCPQSVYRWRVRVRDSVRGDSVWSGWASFATGLLGERWPARWIAAPCSEQGGLPAEVPTDETVATQPTVFSEVLHAAARPEVLCWAADCTEDVQTARRLAAAEPVRCFEKRFRLKESSGVHLLYVAARGAARVYLDDRLLQDAVLDPVQTDYEKLLYYRVYILVGDFALGGREHCLRVELAGGWHQQTAVWGGEFDYGPPSFSLFITEPQNRLGAACAEGGNNANAGASAALAVIDGAASGLASGRQSGIADAPTLQQQLVLESAADWLCRPSAVLATNLYAGEVSRAPAPDKECADGGGTEECYGTGNAAEECHEVSKAAGECAVAMRAQAAQRPVRLVSAVSVPMQAQTLAAVVPMRTLEPTLLTVLADGRLVIDFGENIAGVIELALPVLRQEHTIRIDHVERLDAAGLPEYSTIGLPATRVRQIDHCVAAAGGARRWRPQWGYHGFRYAVVSGWPAGAAAEPTSFKAVVLYNAIAKTGSFHCSDAHLNRIYEIACRSMEGNLHGTFEDCPAREKCGWTGDILASYRGWWLNYDIAATSEKFIRDIRQSADESGIPTAVVGSLRKCGRWLDFGSATVILPHAHYHQTGDVRVLREHFDAMRRYCEAAYLTLGGRLASGAAAITPGDWYDIGLGDWYDIPRAAQPDAGGFPRCSDAVLLIALKVLESLQRMVAVCRILRREADGVRFNGAAVDLAAKLNAIYRDPQTGSYGSQAADALALYLGLSENPQQLLRALCVRLEQNGFHADTGCFGNSVLTVALGALRRPDVALRLLEVEGYPGLKDMLSKGATTLWEDQGAECVAGELSTRSLNHHFHSGYVAFLHWFVAGMRPGEGSVGWDRIVFELPLLRHLEYAQTEVLTPRGKASSRWRRQGGDVRWEVRIPAGASARIALPKATLSGLTVNGCPAADCRALTAVTEVPGFLQASLLAGRYALHWSSDTFRH